ncbi:MAG TPA: type I methionyl aminopeptidase [Candidatus Paceibacterota bacterium]
MKIKSPQEISVMREGGKRLSRILKQVAEAVRPGITTIELDVLAERLIREGGDEPAFLHYKPDFSYKLFPATLCTSVNDEVVHGIPSSRILKEGDIVGLDLGLCHEGLFVDMAVTMGIGELSGPAAKLIETTKRALEAGLSVVRDGARVSDIGATIEKVVLPAGFSIVEELGGHGVGEHVHEAPFIPHFADKSANDILQTGQTIAIEPMINAGGKEVTFDEKDGYTVRTKDGKKSAHFEVTLVVTPQGFEVLTPIFW